MRKKTLLLVLGLSSAILHCSCSAPEEQGGFPYILPKEKPNRKMSAALERNYAAYMAPRPEDNELYTLFKYIVGFKQIIHHLTNADCAGLTCPTQKIELVRRQQFA